MAVRNHWKQLVLSIGLITTLAGIIVGMGVVDQQFVLQGLYVPLGFALALILTTQRAGDSEPLLERTMDSSRALKFITICFSISMVVSISGYRWVAFPLLGGGLFCLTVSLLNKSVNWVDYLGFLLLLAIQPLSRSLATGFYFGTGDLILDIDRVQGLLEKGGRSGIQGVYEQFPGTFYVIGSLQKVSGWDSIPAGEAVAFTTGVALITIIYLLTRLVFGNTARWVFVFGIALPSLSRHMSVYHPQSLGLLFAFLALYAGIQGQMLRYISVGLFAVVALTITHHLTVVLITPILAFWVITDAFDSKKTNTLGRSQLLLAGLVITTYWVYSGYRFIIRTLVTAISHSSAGQEIVYDFEQGGPALTNWGETPSPSSTLEYILSIGPDTQVVYAGFLALFLIGVLYLKPRNPPERDVGFGGIIGSVGLFPSPISYRIISRLSFVSIPFLIAVVANGADQVTHSKYSKLGLLLIVLTVGTAGPFLAADDLDKDGGTYPRAYSDGEMEQLSSISTFAGDSPVSSFWSTQQTSRVFFEMETGEDPLEVSQTGVGGEGLFIVRSRLGGHQIVVDRGSAHLQQVRISNKWMQDAEEQSNVVYDSEEFIVVYRTEERGYGPRYHNQ